MKCPLRDDASIDRQGVGCFVPADCLKEECAWWDDEFEACSFKTLNHYIDRLVRRLEDIREGLKRA